MRACPGDYPSPALDEGEFADCTTEHDQKVADGWFRRGWVPFAAAGFGNLLCVDMDPSLRGKPGQVLCFWHDAAERKVESADRLPRTGRRFGRRRAIAAARVSGRVERSDRVEQLRAREQQRLPPRERST